MDKIFIVKDEGKDINSITRIMTRVRARPVLKVDEQQPLRLPFSGRTDSSNNRLLRVVAGRVAGCDVDKLCGQFIREIVPW